MSNLEQQATVKGAHIAELADQNKNYNLELNQVHQLNGTAAMYCPCYLALSVLHLHHSVLSQLSAPCDHSGFSSPAMRISLLLLLEDRITLLSTCVEYAYCVRRISFWMH